MKRSVILFLLLFLVLSGCNIGNNSSESNSGYSLIRDGEEVEGVNSYENINITVTEKINIQENPYNQIYSDKVNFVLEIENLNEKDILGIRGTLEIYDMFDEKILFVPLQLTYGTVSSGESIVVSDIIVEINRDNERDVKLFHENYDALKFRFSIHEIAFSESSVVQNKTFAIGELPAEVNVLSKENIKIDYVKGILNPRVEFEFQLTNLAEQDIKGLQGYISISNIFGEEINKYNCDFTSDIIPIGNSIVSQGLGIDVDYNSENDIILYGTPYEGLVFEYYLTAVVYTDGTKVDY